MVIKGKGKENSLQSKFEVTAEDKNKVAFANTLQESSTFHTQVTEVNMVGTR